MYKILIALMLLLVLTAETNGQQLPAAGHPAYEIVKDSETLVLKGLLSRKDLEMDSVHFRWFRENRKYGRADDAAVQAFRQKGSQFQVVIFGGTWCHDTQNLLPVFYRLADLSGYADDQITLIGVDRAKTTLDNLHKAFHITNVPTFIVMKDGRELGRVVEDGKYSQIDKELGEIVAGL